MTNPVDRASATAADLSKTSDQTVGQPGEYGTGAPLGAVDSAPGSNAKTTPQPAPGFNAKGKVDRTAVSGVWIGAILAAIVLIVLIIFIAQNSSKATIHFLFLSGHFSIGLTILLAAVIGVLLVAIPGSVRILQLRRALRKNVPTGRKK